MDQDIEVIGAGGEPVGEEEIQQEEVVTAEDPIEEPQEEEKPKKKPGSQKAKEQLLHTREQLAKLQHEFEQLKAKQAPVVDLSKKPVQEDFDSFEDFIDARTEWKLQQKEQEKKQTEHVLTIQEKVNNRLREGAGKFDDFLDLLGNAEAPPAHIRDLLIEEDVPIEVFHQLLSDPEEHRKLNRMSVAKAALKIAEMAAEYKPKKPIKTKAPEPIKPLTSSVKATSKRDDRMEIY